MNRNNLLTEGNEFRLPNGNLYTGSYNVHISKGAMVGARHVNAPHDLLTPVNETVAEKVSSIQEELTAQRQRQLNLAVNLNNQASAQSSSTPPPSGGSSGGGGY